MTEICRNKDLVFPKRNALFTFESGRIDIHPTLAERFNREAQKVCSSKLSNIQSYSSVSVHFFTSELIKQKYHNLFS